MKGLRSRGLAPRGGKTSEWAEKIRVGGKWPGAADCEGQARREWAEKKWPGAADCEGQARRMANYPSVAGDPY